MNIEHLAANSKNLGKALDELFKVSDVLRKDIENLIDTYAEDWSCPTLRRTFIRAYWSMIEGEVYCIKQFTLRACELSSIELSWKEHVFLLEEVITIDSYGRAKLKSIHTPTLTNIKRTLNIVASCFDLDWRPNFCSIGWQQIQRAIEVRHQLSHPKKCKALVISDEGLDEHRAGFVWFVTLINELQLSLQRKYDS